MNIRIGDIVLCRNNDFVEGLLQLNAIYRVRSISCKNELIEIDGIDIPFASFRFNIFLRQNDSDSNMQVSNHAYH